MVKAIARIPPQKRKEEQIRELLKDCTFPKAVADKLVQSALKISSDVDTRILMLRPNLSKITSLSWRINVVISSSHISRALQPFIVLTFELSAANGEAKQLVSIEMTLEKFHLLRFNLSQLLKETQMLQSRSVLQ